MKTACFILSAMALAGTGCVFFEDPTGTGAPMLRDTIGVPGPPGTLRVLFLGNSLTYANDLPGMVQAMADSAAIESVAVHQVTFPDFSLEDHWKLGPALATLRRQGPWAFVVLQQGPSALPSSRTNLIEYAVRWDGEIRRAGAIPVMYMVWPDASRRSAFDSVSTSYRAAAGETGALLAPAGDAWVQAWNVDPNSPLYSGDNFHPSTEGSWLAALTVSGVLFQRPAVDFPASLRTPAGLAVFIPDERATIYRSAADSAIAHTP